MLQTTHLFVSIVLLFDAFTVVPAPYLSELGGSGPPVPSTRIFVKMSEKPDRLRSGGTVSDLYDRVRDLLVYKMQRWFEESSHSDDSTRSIGRYLGFPEETVRLMNTAFTLLLYRQRRRDIDVSNLASAFLYACDLDHWHDPRDATDRTRNVTENFQLIFRGLGIMRSVPYYDVREHDLVAQLEDSLRVVSQPVDPWYSANISLIRNRMFLGEDADETVKKLFTRAGWTEEERNTADFPATGAADMALIMSEHVRFMGKIIPDLLCFAYNHVELLTELRKHHLKDSYASVVTPESSGILVRVVERFMSRYFEFKTGRTGSRVQVVYPLLYFFNPEVAPKTAVPAETAVPDETEVPTALSLLDYRNKDEKFNFDTRVWRLLNDTVDKVLGLFDRPETVQQWTEKRPIKFDCLGQNPDQLLQSMSLNAEGAVKFFATVEDLCKSWDNSY